MQKRHDYLETTRVNLLSDETATADSTDLAESPSVRGLNKEHLQEEFDAITRARGLYYPVPYRFLRELGRGRQGIVFLGLRQGARGCITRHAIKVFDPSIYADPKRYWTDMGRLAEQISELHRVHSPHVVARDIYEETNGIGYVQMEAINGMDLRCFLCNRHLEKARRRATDKQWAHFTDVIFRLHDGGVAIQPGVALHIMRHVLRGLELLHARGFIHSDVKPGNIMMDALGFVKLIDFGRAVRAHERTSMLFGSPLYMAPETHRREASVPQSDLYSVGLVGIELLRGKRLVETEGLTEADLLRHKVELCDRLPDLLPDHVRQNEELVYLLRRFVAPDPGDRYPTAEAAESGREGLMRVHKQLTRLGKDTQYERELENYLSMLVDEKTGQIEHFGSAP